MSDTTIYTNDLKKGDEVRLRHTNWKAIIEDNKKGNKGRVRVAFASLCIGLIIGCYIGTRIEQQHNSETMSYYNHN